MKITLLIKLIVFTLIIIGVYSCTNYYINHDFRQNYSDANKIIHTDSTVIPFFKIHFNNGDISLLEDWHLNDPKDSIIGKGKLFDFNRNETAVGSLAFNIEDIAIIETNQLDQIKSKDNKRIAQLSILSGANLALATFCQINPKACFGSCPTFYLEGRNSLHASSAEGFSSSISPSLERQDLDALRFSTCSSTFSLTMKNEAYETHMVNQLLIQAVPKKNTESVYHDKKGKFYTCGSITPAKTAIADGKEIKNAICELDDFEYFSAADSFELATTEDIIVEFDHDFDQKMGLVINFRQTLLTTFLLYSGIAYMGDEVGDYFAMIETNDRLKKRLGNPFKRLGKIKISYWNETNQTWDFVEELYETGPIAKNLMLVPFDHINTQKSKIKIKLEMAKGLWRLDYLGLTPIHHATKAYSASPSEVQVMNGEKFDLDDLSQKDKKYLVSFPGNQFDFTFNFPLLENEEEYELFLSSTGYYLEWIRPEWIRGKNIPKLRKMLLNNSRTWRDLAREFKAMESEMETVFWNSKFSEIQ